MKLLVTVLLLQFVYCHPTLAAAAAASTSSCLDNYDAIDLAPDNKYYFFVGDNLFTVEKLKYTRSENQPIATVFEDVVPPVIAAFSTGPLNGRMYIIDSDPTINVKIFKCTVKDALPRSPLIIESLSRIFPSAATFIPQPLHAAFASFIPARVYFIGGSGGSRFIGMYSYNTLSHTFSGLSTTSALSTQWNVDVKTASMYYNPQNGTSSYHLQSTSESARINPAIAITHPPTALATCPEWQPYFFSSCCSGPTIPPQPWDSTYTTTITTTSTQPTTTTTQPTTTTTQPTTTTTQPTTTTTQPTTTTTQPTTTTTQPTTTTTQPTTTTTQPTTTTTQPTTTTTQPTTTTTQSTTTTTQSTTTTTQPTTTTTQRTTTTTQPTTSTTQPTTSATQPATSAAPPGPASSTTELSTNITPTSSSEPWSPPKCAPCQSKSVALEGWHAVASRDTVVTLPETQSAQRCLRQCRVKNPACRLVSFNVITQTCLGFTGRALPEFKRDFDGVLLAMNRKVCHDDGACILDGLGEEIAVEQTGHAAVCTTLCRLHPRCVRAESLGMSKSCVMTVCKNVRGNG